MFYNEENLIQIKNKIEKLINNRDLILQEISSFIDDNKDKFQLKFCKDFKNPYFLNYGEEMLGTSTLTELTNKKPRSACYTEFFILDNKPFLEINYDQNTVFSRIYYYYNDNKVTKICCSEFDNKISYIIEYTIQNDDIVELINISLLRGDQYATIPPLINNNNIRKIDGALIEVDGYHYIYNSDNMIINFDKFSRYIYPYDFNFYDDEKYREIAGKKIYFDFPRLNPESISEHTIIYENGYANRYRRKDFDIYNKTFEHMWSIPTRIVKLYNKHNIFVFGKITGDK
jgi:hypothetical protein